VGMDAQTNVKKKRIHIVLVLVQALVLFVEMGLRMDLKLVMIAILHHLMDVLLNVRSNLHILVLT